MLSKNEQYEIEIGMAQQAADGRFSVTWALYRRHRFSGDKPVYFATTEMCGDPFAADKRAREDAEEMARELG